MHFHIPKKRFGQNFLIDKNVVSRTLQESDISHADNVLEIGPGKGFLTDDLLQNAGKVVAIELDKDLYDNLKLKYKENENLFLIQGDCLKIDWDAFPVKVNKLVANIPYNISSQIIFRALDYYSLFDTVVFMIQKEVADRIVSSCNSKEYGVLSVICQKFWEIKICMRVSRKVFRPAPKVDSALIKFIPKYNSIDFSDVKRFVEFVKFCFNQRRKILFKRLVRDYGLRHSVLLDFYKINDLDLNCRAENIDVDLFWELLKDKDRDKE
ncbi:16S rRNA (adenine(1518)-N(6)/adenine(1519)-N(6))-dimethyltransferase RsmA [bacterium]